jgi:glutaredoxin 3
MASRTGAAWISFAVAGMILMQLGSPVEARTDSLAFVKKTVAEHPLVIFSKSYCPYCKRAKSVFESMSVKPFVLELDEREDGDDIQQALGKFVGRRTVPQVFINGVHLGGSDDTVAAQQSGRLKNLLAGSASAVNAENLKSEL